MPETSTGKSARALRKSCDALLKLAGEWCALRDQATVAARTRALKMAEEWALHDKASWAAWRQTKSDDTQYNETAEQPDKRARVMAGRIADAADLAYQRALACNVEDCEQLRALHLEAREHPGRGGDQFYLEHLAAAIDATERLQRKGAVLLGQEHRTTKAEANRLVLLRAKLTTADARQSMVRRHKDAWKQPLPSEDNESGALLLTGRGLNPSEAESVRIARRIPDGARDLVFEIAALNDAESIGFSHFKCSAKTAKKYVGLLEELRVVERRKGQGLNNLMRGPTAVGIAEVLKRSS